MNSRGVAVVSRRGEGRVQRGHPWIFRSDVSRVEGAEPGAVVQVVAASGRPLGFAFFSSRSEITLRVIQRGAEELPADWLRQRLQAAIAWRERVARGASTCRLVHAEGDGLPSIVVDRYERWLVLQTLSQAAEALKPELTALLVELMQPEGVLERNDPRVRELEGLERKVSVLHGQVPELVEVSEDGVRLPADLWRGQKTGLFLDQRENHLLAREYARGRVLDAFTYTGGFALQMASVAEEVLAVDVSADALARVNAAAALNGLADRVHTREANVFDLLRELQERRERFHTIVLDPPAFAKSKDAVEKAWRGYKEINLRALRLLEPGGTLITCSCSQHVHEDDFEQIVTDAARDAHCTVALIEKRRQARDHPVLLGVPETYYLKCFVLRKLG